MKLRIEFGMYGPKKEFTWWKDVTEFPTLVKLNGENWEWIMYDKDRSGGVDWVLTYAKVLDYESNFNAFARELDDIMGGCLDDSCQCGAIYTSFPWDHMRCCPKWIVW